MATHYRRILDYLGAARGENGLQQASRLKPRHDPAPPRVPGGSGIDAETIEQRWALPGIPPTAREALMDGPSIDRASAYARNIENFIGTVKVPVGLAGPLRVNGVHAHGDVYVPLATTEAALVASYSRGAQLVTEAGGCAAIVLNEGVSRAPGFVFNSLAESAVFVAWAAGCIDSFRAAALETTRHGVLVDMHLTVEGNHVYMGLEFQTGDASGQNMVTIAAEAICRYILDHTPVAPIRWYIEANMSGDKKATTHSFMGVRGKKLSAEVVIPGELIERRLHTSAAALVDYSRMSAFGGVMSGSIGVQGHYANGLAALFIACGQDAASVAEAAVGVTRFELGREGSLYVSVTLPNLIVGTIGGGTGLPSQKACLDILGVAGANGALAFAEIAAAVALAGELSIVGALAAGQFTQAHQRLARPAAAPSARLP
jgi:hydroxymethylglutaryl-CoA reductase (NADPH)